MSIQFNGLNVSEMQFNGQNVIEAMYNGELVYSSAPASNYPQSNSWGPVDTSGIELQDQHEVVEDGMYRVDHFVQGTGNFRSLIQQDGVLLKSISSAGTSTATSEYVGRFNSGSIVMFSTEVLGAVGTILELSGEWNVDQIPADEEITGSYVYQNVPQTIDSVNDPKYLTFIDYIATAPGGYRFQVADTTQSANFNVVILLNGQVVEDATVTPPAILDETLTLAAGDQVKLAAATLNPSVYTYGGTWTVTPL